MSAETWTVILTGSRADLEQAVAQLGPLAVEVHHERMLEEGGEE